MGLCASADAASADAPAKTVPAAEKSLLLASDHSADPSARVINGVLYVIASHDRPNRRAEDDKGAHFDMRSYKLLRFSDDMGVVEDVGDILALGTIPWAGKQLWAPDMLAVGGRVFAYFPARDRKGRFRIGAAVADRPEGPWTVQKEPIQGTYSIDPGMLATGGKVFMYWGGLLGGELQNYPVANGGFVEAEVPAKGDPLRCRVAELGEDMVSLAGEVKEIVIVDEEGVEIQAEDARRIFFEGPFVYERVVGGVTVFYLLYSTGFSHLIQHATASSPLGPFTWRGVVLTPPEGWTSQVSVVEYIGKSWLFYHDAKRSGKTHLRDVKFQELKYREDGSIKTMSP